MVGWNIFSASLNYSSDVFCTTQDQSSGRAAAFARTTSFAPGRAFGTFSDSFVRPLAMKTSHREELSLTGGSEDSSCSSCGVVGDAAEAQGSLCSHRHKRARVSQEQPCPVKDSKVGGWVGLAAQCAQRRAPSLQWQSSQHSWPAPVNIRRPYLNLTPPNPLPAALCPLPILEQPSGRQRSICLLPAVN